MSGILKTLVSYQAWANDALFKALRAMDTARHQAEFHQAMRLVSHIHIVSEIFAAHLEGRPHGYKIDNTEATPDLEDLHAAISARDQWYLDYLSDASPQQLAEKTGFSFTDGDRGYMSREEMITHVVTHATYHRGEAGRILMQQAIEGPWDTFAVFLHAHEPERRLQGRDEIAGELHRAPTSEIKSMA
jgi:uncharacterized damage-inducible protein DinB